MPIIGDEKLCYLFNNDFKKLKIGRDKFISNLRTCHFGHTSAPF